MTFSISSPRCGWRYPLLIIAKGGSFSTVSTLRLFSSTSIACGFLYEEQKCPPRACYSSPGTLYVLCLGAHNRRFTWLQSDSGSLGFINIRKLHIANMLFWQVLFLKIAIVFVYSLCTRSYTWYKYLRWQNTAKKQYFPILQTLRKRHRDRICPPHYRQKRRCLWLYLWRWYFLCQNNAPDMISYPDSTCNCPFFT